MMPRKNVTRMQPVEVDDKKLALLTPVLDGGLCVFERVGWFEMEKGGRRFMRTRDGDPFEISGVWHLYGRARIESWKTSGCQDFTKSRFGFGEVLGCRIDAGDLFVEVIFHLCLVELASIGGFGVCVVLAKGPGTPVPSVDRAVCTLSKRKVV